MSLESYGVLKGKPKDWIYGTGRSPHFQILVYDGQMEHRIAVNVRSRVPPSELLYYVDEDFDHPVISRLESLDMGFHSLEDKKDMSLDYVRGGLFDVSSMEMLHHDISGPDNDLNEKIRDYVKAAIKTEGTVYAFGKRWGPDSYLQDSCFGFRPGSGIHDVHMNQGSTKKWKDADKPYHDGGLLIHLPEEKRWVALYLAFQSQCFVTDEVTGHCKEDTSGEAVVPGCLKHRKCTSAGTIRIVAALVDPSGDDPGLETITLINASPEDVNIDDWMIVDRNNRTSLLKGTIMAGAGAKIHLSGKGAQLYNKGGSISLFDEMGVMMHEVNYVKEDIRTGWMIVF
ncbi:DUF2278 family protein [Methanolobus halotolerans]|uniref:DUF2278 domain-containing protein n=1 Tax=Methanolobus halotolerans TaxID=2052935 RepID=A0A4E0PWH0_9EURY|nr:DUF2278 family protein [Methanolobus halotolerans]TGC08907.1 DUF2278 domain-containing protein [Methanolobus halotolerans]